MEKLLIIDGNSLLNRAYYALPPMNSADGQNINAVFGFLNLLFKAMDEVSPSHIVVAFDKRGDNPRKKIFPEYKANRKGMPDDLALQMPVLFEVLGKMNITMQSKAGIEADDIIGSVCKKFCMPTVVLSGDKDLLQLASGHVEIWLTKKGITEVEKVNSQNIFELFQMNADQVVSYKALRGDASDNIPGVAGIGEKTAISLISEFGTLDNIFDNVEKTKGSVQAKLIAGRESAYISRDLAQIVTDVHLDIEKQDTVLKNFESDILQMFAQLQFKSLLKKAEKHLGDAHAETEMQVEEVFEVCVVSSAQQLSDLATALAQEKEVAVNFHKNIFLSDGKKEYEVEISDNFLVGFNLQQAMDTLKKVFECRSVRKIMYDSKKAKTYLKSFGVDVNSVDADLSIMQYLVEYRSHKDFESLRGAYGFSSNCICLFKLRDILAEKLKENHVDELYNDVELPLASVLFDMERQGIAVDKEALNLQGVKYQNSIEQISQEIFDLAEEKFNILSPKQLGVILFEKLGLPATKKTKTGYSTDNDGLEKLKGMHPIVEKVSQIRKLSNLNGTYIEGMRPLVAKDGKIHTTFNQTLTSTGRLSSSEPNLQNLPARDEEGMEIKKLFVTSKDMLISADYSQIELRLLAHFSEDENLIQAFNAGRDIHTAVAAEIFAIPEEMVTSSMRRMAKAVNFGIIYGISDFGLAQNIGIAPKKAKLYIENYFKSYPKIKDYLNSLKEMAKKDGFVTTITGRRRQIPEINSANFQLRSFGERAAMNMPLQGSAADIMKIAMNNVAGEMKRRNLSSNLILQVHDELVIDTVASEEKVVKEILQQQMSDHFKLLVELKIDVKQGRNLYEAK